MDTIQIIRDTFASLLKEKAFVPDKTGQNTLEVLGAQFIADEDSIFGIPNQKYITREIGWYLTGSLNIKDLEPPLPLMWQVVASNDGFVNSNYGYLVFNPHNYSQFDNCISELLKNQWSRRAVMIYTRPAMWHEYDKDGMSDFICTNTVQYFIRPNPVEKNTLRLFARVDMRSNDAWAGYRNDYAWQRFVLNAVFTKLKERYHNLRRGAIIWGCGSLHVYERNFDLVQYYIDTGCHNPHPKELSITRKELIGKGVIR